MASYKGWNEGGTTRGGGDGSLFLKLQAGNKYKLRLVGRALHYHQFWEPIVVRSPFQDENGKVICPLMQQGFTPKDRYSIWVMDRNDNNKLKIMDFPPSLYNKFKDWYDENGGEEPGGANGPDWSVKLSAPTGNQRFTKYEAMPLDRTPFTDEEKTKIREGKLKERLLDVRKDDSPDEIREKYAEYLKKAKGEQPAPRQEPSRVQSTSTEAAPKEPASSGGSDSFDDMEF